MFGVIAIIIIIVITVNLNNRMNKLEELIQKQMEKKSFSDERSSSSIQSAENKVDSTYQPETAGSFVEEEKKDEYHEIQQNLQKSMSGSSEVDAVDLKRYEDDFVTNFFSWLAKDWPMKVGAFLVISAIGWFVSYAFRNDWISPEGRVWIPHTIIWQEIYY